MDGGGKMRQFTFFTLVLVLSLTIASGEIYVASGWSDPALITEVDDSPDSLTIDPSGNLELVYDSEDDENNMVRIKYFNSASVSPVTVVEYQTCLDAMSCPPGFIMELEGLTSARDSTGKLHVAYAIQRAYGLPVETFYMYKDTSGWSDPAPITAIGDAYPGSLTIDPSGNWELVYDSWDDDNNMVRIKYFNSASASPVTVVEYPLCFSLPCPPGSIGDFDNITSARDATGKLHVAYEIDSAVDYTNETFYMYKDVSGWSTPSSITAVVDGADSLSIDPSGNWALVYYSWDDENNMVRIKYFNSASVSPVTVIEYQRCPCPPGSIAGIGEITSARDSTGKLHVAYGIYSAGEVETFYIYMDDTSYDFTIDPVQGTISTELTINGWGCGEKKGKVFIGTRKCKVLGWTDTSIICLIKKVKKTMGPGTYDVTIIPKGKGIESIVMANAFSIMAPDIQAVTTNGNLATITGLFFGTKKVKAYLVLDGKGGRKKMKVAYLEMDPVTGVSQLKVTVSNKVLKKLEPGSYDVIVTNKVGSDSFINGFTK